MESLIISDLSFSFGSKIIFDQFSLKLELGKMYALVGASGVGKSTLAHLIAGHLLPQSGTICLGSSQRLSKIEKPLRDIFIVHQEDDLFPWLDVVEQLEFVGAKKASIEHLLDVFNLQDSKKLYPSQLSGGMKKRLALIRAELVGAKVLILDETFSSLNINLLHDILKDMAPRWRSQKMTVIFITHHLNDIKDYIDQVISL